VHTSSFSAACQSRLVMKAGATAAREPAPFVCHRTFNFETLILFLPDVLKERSRQHRQVKLDVKNDEEHAEKAAPDSHLQKLTGVGHD
jgi:hypothetical protein